MTKYAPYTGQAAIARAKNYVGKKAFSNMCQAFVVTVYGTGAVGDYDGDRDADAVDGWKKAKAKGRVVLAKNIKSYRDIPAGVALYWTGGSRGYGHAAISIGGGKMISTDVGKTWGYVGIADIDHIEKRWGNGLKFVGYVLAEGNGHTLTDPPRQPAKDKPEYPAWYAAWMRNLGGLNDAGLASWDRRAPLIAKDIAASPYFAGSVQAFLELPKSKLADWDSRMAVLGLKRAAGGHGRYIYVPRAAKVRAGGVFDLKPRYQGDDKQAAWASVDLPSRDDPDKIATTLIVAGHLEHQDGSVADRTRVDQAKNLIAQTERKADDLGLAWSRCLVLVDSNSRGLVKSNAFEAAGWVDAFDTATNYTNRRWYSFVGWDYRLVVGTGIDYAFVPRTRPVVYAAQRRAGVKGVLDHLPVCVVTGWGTVK